MLYILVSNFLLCELGEQNNSYMKKSLFVIGLAAVLVSCGENKKTEQSAVEPETSTTTSQTDEETASDESTTTSSDESTTTSQTDWDAVLDEL